jgi:large subunit ribosomal protein L22
MQFVAKLMFLRISPFKLRPYIDIVRGKNVEQSVRLLATMAVKRAVPIKKMIESAAANAKDRENYEQSELMIKKIFVDQGPIYKYFKPGAMGRSNVLRKRFSHATVILEPISKKVE